MKKKISLITALSILGIIGIVTPSVLYANAGNVVLNTNNLQTNLSSVYTREYEPVNYSNTEVNNLSAEQQFDSQQVYKYANLYQMLNGDENINNGNYLVIIGNQTELGYQAFAYNNFVTADTLEQYTANNLMENILSQALMPLTNKIPVFEYLQFPSLIQANRVNNNLSIYNIYENFSPQNTTSSTIEDNLYMRIISYAKRI